VLRKAETISESRVGRAVPYLGLLWLYASAMVDLLQAKRPDGRVLWNAPALTALCRPLQDAFIALYYFGIEVPAAEEAEFRELLLERHAAFKRRDLLERSDQSVPKIRSELADASKHYDAVQEKFAAHPFLGKLSGGVVNDLMARPEKFIAEPLHEVWARAGMSGEQYDVLFRYLSQYTHATPYAVAQLAYHQADHEDGAANMNVPIGLAITCTIVALKHIGTLHEDLDALLPEAFHKFMKG